MNPCLICHELTCRPYLDLGEQAISHRYGSKDVQAATVSLMMGQCESCGQVQLVPPPSPELLRPQYPWIKYNEPEKHLDDLNRKILDLPGVTKESSIAGVSYKEDSTLERFRTLGMNRVQGLGEVDQADVIIARHIVEHQFSPLSFVEALKKKLKADGHIVFEVPDCERAFKNLDYTAIWEDHSLYFSEKTFRNLFNHAGLELIWFNRYEYAYEHCLVGMAQIKKGLIYPEKTVAKRVLKDISVPFEQDPFQQFVRSFHSTKQTLQSKLQDFKQSGGNIAMFGSGHSAVAYINYLELEPWVECVIDDDPNKVDLQMPGSKLNIVNSNALRDKNIKLCLMSLSAESEEKVIRRHESYIHDGGRFESIFQRD